MQIYNDFSINSYGFKFFIAKREKYVVNQWNKDNKAPTITRLSGLDHLQARFASIA